MDSPLSLALKMDKPEFSGWIMGNCPVDYFLEDQQGALPLELSISKNDLALFTKIVGKMGISRVALPEKKPLFAKFNAQEKSRRSPGSLPQTTVFRLIQAAITQKNRSVFYWLLDFCKSQDPR